MGEIVRLPIKERGNFALGEQHVHAQIGTVQIISAQIMTDTGPTTWGVFLRRPGFPDAMVCNVVMTDRDSFSAFVGTVLCIVEKSLRMSRDNIDALMNDTE
jgi:hypothetical protein